MKILFLAYDHALDFHQDLVCHGLAELLGPENVLVHPRVERYHVPPPDDLEHIAMSYPNLPTARTRSWRISQPRRTLSSWDRPAARR